MPGRRPILASLLATAILIGSVGGVAAQMPPYTACGMGLQPTDTVTTTTEGVECGSARVASLATGRSASPLTLPAVRRTAPPSTSR